MADRMLAVATQVLALAALAGLASCAPVVTHPARVRPGTEFGMAGGWSLPACDSCRAGLVPPIGATMRTSWTPRGPQGPGYSVGLLIPGFIFLPGSTLDLYTQMPAPPGEPVYGGGVTVSFMDVMPYLQFGREDERGHGWYTTQGIVLAAFRPEPEVFLNGGNGIVFERVAAVYWSPTVAYHEATATLYLSGAFGSHDPGTAHEPLPRQPVIAVLFGMSVQTRNPFSFLDPARLPPRQRR
ncbi:MAG TPA: hypothetical protein VGB24_20645 [Longimicrobium sp.]|jgi:hypothetical protein|uniref:hypothetical protein n=1 Tax=Longimicrobium sp. TaxID=2029185 RepID=UPI002ED9E4C1